jgi:hypothetical protein
MGGPIIHYPSALIFIFGLIIRTPFILIPPSSGLYNVDELVMSFSVVDHWLGLPATNLYWPAVPLQLWASLFVAPEFSAALLADRSLDKLTHVIFAHYQDPSSVILTLRLLSSLAGAATAVALYQLVREVSESSLAGIIAAVISTLMPVSLQLSVMATADAVALMFCAWAARWLLCSPARPFLVGLSSAAAVSTKAAMGIWLVPIFLGGLLFIYQNQGVRQLWSTIHRSIGAGIAGTIMFFPYLWIDPLRSAKNIIGAALAHTNNTFPNMDFFSIAISGQSVLILFVVLSLLAGLAALRSERWRYGGIGVAVVMAALLLFFLKIGFDYWRYMIGAIVPGLVLLGILLIRRERAFALVLLPVTIVGLGSQSLYDELRRREEPGLRQIFKMVEEKCERGEVIWLQDSALSFQYDRLLLPHSTILEIVSYFENPDKSRVVTKWIEAAGVTPSAAVALQSAFDEREQVALARWRGLAAINMPAPKCQMQLFRSESTEADSTFGYVRGSLTTKTREDVRVALGHPTNTAINVIGETEVLNSIGVPIVVATRGKGWAIGIK